MRPSSLPVATIRSRIQGEYTGAVVLTVACPHGRHGHTIALLDGRTQDVAWCTSTGRAYQVGDAP